MSENKQPVPGVYEGMVNALASPAKVGEAPPPQSHLGVPANYMIVPIKPSREMVKAGERWSALPEQTWQDMIDAAPIVEVEPPATDTLADFATRLFDLHGFMLLETYRGKHAVTVTFPDLKEAQQFHNTLAELSQHRSSSEDKP